MDRRLGFLPGQAAWIEWKEGGLGKDSLEQSHGQATELSVANSDRKLESLARCADPQLLGRAFEVSDPLRQLCRHLVELRAFDDAAQVDPDRGRGATAATTATATASFSSFP
jgi:hypothetical protein